MKFAERHLHAHRGPTASNRTTKAFHKQLFVGENVGIGIKKVSDECVDRDLPCSRRFQKAEDLMLRPLARRCGKRHNGVRVRRYVRLSPRTCAVQMARWCMSRILLGRQIMQDFLEAIFAGWNVYRGLEGPMRRSGGRKPGAAARSGS